MINVTTRRLLFDGIVEEKLERKIDLILLLQERQETRTQFMYYM